MASEAVFVWHGGSRVLGGKTLPAGKVLDAEFVDGLRTKNALLSMGVIRVEMRQMVKKKRATASSSTKKATAKKKSSKKTTPKESDVSVSAPVEPTTEEG